MMLGSLLRTTCKPSLLGPNSSLGGKIGYGTLTYRVAVAVLVAVAVAVGVLSARSVLLWGRYVGASDAVGSAVAAPSVGVGTTVNVGGTGLTTARSTRSVGS